MPEFVTVAQTTEFNSGDRIVVEVKDHYIAIFRVSDNFYAIEDVCTHDDGPLADGELNGVVITCPRHGAQFDVATGKVLSMPAITPVPRYELRIQGEDIQILI